MAAAAAAVTGVRAGLRDGRGAQCSSGSRTVAVRAADGEAQRNPKSHP